MRKSGESAAVPDILDLELPDWSGMKDSMARRVSPEAALEYCGRFLEWFPELSTTAQSQRAPKCEVEFVL